MECKNCAFRFPSIYEYCGKCGTRVAIHKTCHHCGSKVPSDYNFCGVCGTKQMDVTKEIIQSKQHKLPETVCSCWCASLTWLTRIL